jgi:hypothetical protein
MTVVYDAIHKQLAKDIEANIIELPMRFGQQDLVKAIDEYALVLERAVEKATGASRANLTVHRAIHELLQRQVLSNKLHMIGEGNLEEKCAELSLQLERAVHIALTPKGWDPHPMDAIRRHGNPNTFFEKPGELRVMQPTEVVLRIVVEGAQVNKDGQ